MGNKKKQKTDQQFSPPPDYNWRNLNIIFLAVLILIAGLSYFNMIKMFLVPLITGIAFTVLFYPLYKKLNKALKDKPRLASTLMIILFIILLVLPTYFLSMLVISQANDLYEQIVTTYQKDGAMLFEQFQSSVIVQWIVDNDIDWQSSVQNAVQSVSQFITQMVNKASSSLIDTVLGLFIMVFAMFFLFVDGDKFLKRIKYLSPLRNRYENDLFSRFSVITRATIKGALVIGFLQGFASSITLMIFKINAWAFWGVIILILSMIPMVGAPVVMVPIAIVQFSKGNILSGIIILIVGVGVNAGIDLLIRPALVGKEGKMHRLLVLVSILGGIASFGLLGFIIGPVIAVFFFTLLDIYGKEFRGQLTHRNTTTVDLEKDKPEPSES